jgi:two-component system nitrate/nitrite response regulator NarL
VLALQCLHLEMPRRGSDQDADSLAYDGADVLPIMEREKVDLVILDVMMPRMNGLETLTAIKKKSPKTRVIMLSGYGTTNYVEQAERLGSDGFINKPFGVETLMRHVRTVLAGLSRTPFLEPPIG